MNLISNPIAKPCNVSFTQLLNKWKKKWNWIVWFAGAIFTDLEADLGEQVIVENKNNPLTVDLTGITHDDSTNVVGEELWLVGAYASMNAEGSGTKTGYVEQILDLDGSATDLNDDENLMMDGTDFEFDMTGISCAEAPYLCFDLDKNPRASVSYIFEDRPDESVTTTCIDMRERCKGKCLWSLTMDFYMYFFLNNPSWTKEY